MRFQFTEDQVGFRDGVRAFFDKECPAEVVRAAWDGKPTDLWPRLAEMGVVGMTAPEEHGGLAMDELDLVLVLEEAGRVALPEPLLETTAVAIPLLRDAGGPMATRWLPRLASGDARAAVGLGLAPLVADADRADVVVDDHDGCIHAVETTTCDLTPRPAVDGARPMFALGWSAEPGTKVEGADMALALDRAAVAAGAELCGLAARMIDMTVDYAKAREQFGRPIGAFQAVQHHLADALLALEFARPVVYRGAYAVARGEADFGMRASMAKAYAGDAAQRASRIALQVHGAIGYSWEHDLHLFMKRAWALAASWGDGRFHRRRVGEWLRDEGETS